MVKITHKVYKSSQVQVIIKPGFSQVGPDKTLGNKKWTQKNTKSNFFLKFPITSIDSNWGALGDMKNADSNSLTFGFQAKTTGHLFANIVRSNLHRTVV